MLSNGQTHKQTDPTTVTLAAHARRGLINTGHTFLVGVRVCSGSKVSVVFVSYLGSL